MSGGVSAYPSLYSHIPSSNTQSITHFCNLSSPCLTPRTGSLPTLSLRCNSTSNPRGPAPGGNENRSVLDAFFLGKAVAEALNERIESTVGEFLSTIGRLQAEQQKQVQDFQEEVVERAKRAKEKAAREAMEAQGLIPNSLSTENKSIVTNGVSVVTTTVNDQNPTNIDPLLENSNDD